MKQKLWISMAVCISLGSLIATASADKPLNPHGQDKKMDILIVEEPVVAESVTEELVVYVLDEQSSGFCFVDGQIDSNHEGFTGTGFLNTDNIMGSSILWNINANQAGIYPIEIRYANGGATARAGLITVDGAGSQTVAFDSTGAWTSWQTETINVALESGDNAILIKANGIDGLANIDKITLTGSGLSDAQCAEPIVVEEPVVEEPVVVEEPSSPILVMPYDSISNSEYTIELDYWDIPNDGTEPEKTTDNLQAAIDWASAEGFGIIRLPAGHYLIGKYGSYNYQAGIELKSNMAFLMDKDAIVEMAPNDKWNYCAVWVKGKDNVVISGGTILGERYEHIYTPRESDGSTAHDEGHLICITHESEYVTVENVELGKANGDAILLAGWAGEGSSVKYIDIRENNMFYNRRQGVSIVGGENVLIENNEIHHTGGTRPDFGIDIESVIYSSKDIIIRGNYFHHNLGGDIVNFDGLNVLVEDNILEEGEGITHLDGPLVYHKNADLTIRNNTITRTQSGRNCIIMYSNDNPKTNPATTYIEGNTLNNCGFNIYKGADLDIQNNNIINGNLYLTEMTNVTFSDNNISGSIDGGLTFKDMTNLTIENNIVENEFRGSCWVYRLSQVTGYASGNTHNSVPIDLFLNSEPWDSCWYQ